MAPPRAVGLGHGDQLAPAIDEAARAQKAAGGSGLAAIETHVPGGDTAVIGAASEEERIGAAAAASPVATPVQNGEGAGPGGGSGTGKTEL